MSTERPEDANSNEYEVWPEDGSGAAEVYRAYTECHAAEKRAHDDYEEDRPCSGPYRVRDVRTGQIWIVPHVGLIQKPSFVAIHSTEVPVAPATHVLWGGKALCEDLRLRGVPRDWPEGQRWLSLRDVADNAYVLEDRCEACWTKATEIAAGLRQIGADR